MGCVDVVVARLEYLVVSGVVYLSEASEDWAELLKFYVSISSAIGWSLLRISKPKAAYNDILECPQMLLQTLHYDGVSKLPIFCL